MNRKAVIDIGSNSVRLVVYRIVRSAAIPHFNEKVLAGLGRGLTETGKLSEKGRSSALEALKRYRAIITALDVEEISVIATAAVREAEDGAEFVSEAEEILEFPVRVLSGQDEAQLSARGVLFGTFDANGIAGDLGGSSLEFCRVGESSVIGGETHMLGPLSFDASTQISEREQRVAASLQSSELISAAPGGVFYAVGGAWRAMAKLHIHLEGYPLAILHGYRIAARDVEQFTRRIILGSAHMQSQIREITGRAPQAIKHAALVLQKVFQIGGFEQLYISSNGVREGVLTETVLRAAGDPLIDGIAATAHLDETQYAFGDALHRFVKPALPLDGDLFGLSQHGERIDRAACMLADSGARLHPDHRADIAYDLTLRGAYAGATHSQRAYMALAVGCRYYKSFRRPLADRVMMPQKRADRARQLGALMRLGAVFSGRTAENVNFASLQRNGNQLVLSVEPSHSAMVSSTVHKRLAQAAQHLYLEPQIEILPS